MKLCGNFQYQKDMRISSSCSSWTTYTELWPLIIYALPFKMEKKVSTKLPFKIIIEEQPFTKPGKCLDEVTFEFDDGSKLYVSENFLRYVSPVFRAMFEHNWKEKKTRTVKLNGKDYKHFLEFLLCLHPDVQKPVSDMNVLQIVHLAEEYQAALIKQKCKETMEAWLKSELDEAQTISSRYSDSTLNKSKRARTCLKILLDANSLNYQDIVEKARLVIGRFGHTIFTGNLSTEDKFYYDAVLKRGDGKDDPLTDCRNLFNELPKTLKYDLILTRLSLVDNTDMK